MSDTEQTPEISTMLPPPNRPAPADRNMNDSTMPPPRYANNAKLSTTKKPAVNPKHRFGLHDWKRLLQVSTDLAQRKGQPIRRDITPEEVRQHCKNHDGWIILRGRVYNIGPYLPYHPGGITIFKNLLGKDATTMFDKYHRWVNIDGLIGPLLLGFIAGPPKANPFSVVPPKESHLSNAPRLSTQAASGSSLLAQDDEEEEDEDEEDAILPPTSSPQSS